jgi:hypothetical protein
VDVDLMSPAAGAAARLAVHKKDGSVASSQVQLDQNGDATKVVGFSSQAVSFAELTIVNASTQTACWQGSFSDEVQHSCLGAPLHDQAISKVSARILHQ